MKKDQEKETKRPFMISESYISITLGFLVVLVGAVMAYNYFTGTKTIGEKKDIETVTKEDVEQKQEEAKLANLPTNHTVADGETLWAIAEKYYGSGYNWVSIAKENNLTGADLLTSGQSLRVPVAQVIKPGDGQTLATATMPERTYTVVQGDSLWNIAVREYGDGFMWSKIAQANSLANPNLIFAGNQLTLPAN